MKYIFIVNPISGGKSKTKLIQYLNEFCLSNGLDFVVKHTEYAGHAKEIAKQYFDSDDTVVIAVGGDGTVNEVASSLIGARSIFHVIPCGSGNGFARHNKILLDYKKNLSAMLGFATYKYVDTCFLNDIPFFNVSGIGFDAYISQKFSQIKGRGFINYVRAVITHYRKESNNKVVLKFDRKEIAENAFFISFANTSQFGNNVHIAPEACNYDGLVDVVVVTKIPLYLMPLVAFSLFTKKKINSRYVKYYRTSMIEVDCEPITVHVDGEPIDETYSYIKIVVSPLSLKILA